MPTKLYLRLARTLCLEPVARQIAALNTACIVAPQAALRGGELPGSTVIGSNAVHIVGVVVIA